MDITFLGSKNWNPKQLVSAKNQEQYENTSKVKAQGSPSDSEENEERGHFSNTLEISKDSQWEDIKKICNYEKWKHRAKVHKDWKVGSTLVLGEDVSLYTIASLLETTLIGKFMFRSISKGEFNLWVKKKMIIFLRCVLIWHLMLKGCIYLEFKSTFDLETILAQPWLFGYSNLVLKGYSRVKGGIPWLHEDSQAALESGPNVWDASSIWGLVEFYNKKPSPLKRGFQFS